MSVVVTQKLIRITSYTVAEILLGNPHLVKRSIDFKIELLATTGILYDFDERYHTR